VTFTEILTLDGASRIDNAHLAAVEVPSLSCAADGVLFPVRADLPRLNARRL